MSTVVNLRSAYKNFTGLQHIHVLQPRDSIIDSKLTNFHSYLIYATMMQPVNMVDFERQTFPICNYSLNATIHEVRRSQCGTHKNGVM